MAEKQVSSLEKLLGENQFSDAAMQRYLSEDTYNAFQSVLREQTELDPRLADQIAEGMRVWATERGATHFTHWFQPMHGVTAEKHEAFLDYSKSGDIGVRLSGKALIRGEPDASSFPSGGLRATFEARGYTTWDYTSPAFLKEDRAGVTLCIPTAFCSSGGEALDEKTPLLRALKAQEQQVLRLLRLLGDTESREITMQVGAEQEYFLVDRRQFDRRMDMVFCGRTLFGARPGKSQEMEGHYYGAIKERIARYMRELDEQLWKMGVPAKTRHNEVAPAQHELACLYTEANIASDQNQLIMETMQRVAEHHNLACLLAGKPFSYINGSGKHNNWSLGTDNGWNLFAPGRTVLQNRVFLTLVGALVAAVDKHAGFIRLTAASRENDLRLGGCEAPPAILSICLGAPLTAIFDSIEQSGRFPDALLPRSLTHDSDRNRTSPLAFTGNRFEFRMLSAAQNISPLNVALSAALCESIDELCTKLEASADTEQALTNALIDLWRTHKRVVFNGNGYSEEWLETAQVRALPNSEDTLDALPALLAPEVVSLLEKYDILSAVELDARHEVRLSDYIHALFLEASTMLEMVDRQILPACMRYQSELAGGAAAVTALTGLETIQGHRVREMSMHMEQAHQDFERVKRTMELGKAPDCAPLDRARLYRDRLIPAMNALRADCDALERMVPDDAWPLPTYNELLFNI